MTPMPVPGLKITDQSESGFFRIWDLIIPSYLIDSRRNEISKIVEHIKKRLQL
jgi:hypothetical protein